MSAPLDCRGRRCPLPVVELAADDPAARVDVPAWCRMRGHDYLGETAADDGTPVYSVRRRA